MTATVDSASRLAYLAFSNPVIKALAFASPAPAGPPAASARQRGDRTLMFKRLFWLVVGAGFGFGVSFWLMRFVRETVARYTPERSRPTSPARSASSATDIRAAVAEGRDAMREREAELRAAARGPLARQPRIGEPSLN